MAPTVHSQTLQCEPVLDSITCLLNIPRFKIPTFRTFKSVWLRVEGCPSLLPGAISATRDVSFGTPVHFNLYLRRQTQHFTEDKDALSSLCSCSASWLYMDDGSQSPLYQQSSAGTQLLTVNGQAGSRRACMPGWMQLFLPSGAISLHDKCVTGCFNS